MHPYSWGLYAESEHRSKCRIWHYQTKGTLDPLLGSATFIKAAIKLEYEVWTLRCNVSGRFGAGRCWLSSHPQQPALHSHFSPSMVTADPFFPSMHASAWCIMLLLLLGLYGNEGILDAGWLIKPLGRPLLDQLWDSPTLLWLGPHLGLDTSQMMELISLLGALLSFGALVLEPLRDSLIFFLLWFFYLSLFQVPLP